MNSLDDAMRALRDEFTDAEWFPTVFTPTLSGTEEFVTDGDALIKFIDAYWKEKDVEGKFLLDDWQKFLIRHVLERYPDDWPVKDLAGRLRYRQVLISMGRQNGKSILGAIFGVYGLMFHEARPNVVGVAYSKLTAGVVYGRVAYTLTAVKPLAKRTKVTKTQGIRRTDKPGEYIIKPNSEQAIQGFPISLCIYDEVHITSKKLWDAATEGTKTYKDGIVIGISTAGDDNAELLKSLYERGYFAVDNQGDEDAQRFGFFLWEAPEGATIDDDEAIKAANPSVASGRVALRVVRANAKEYHPSDATRYVLNRFVTSNAAWLELSEWLACEGTGLTKEDTKKGTVFYGVDASASMDYVSISGARQVSGIIKEALVGSYTMPSKEKVVDRCLRLARKGNVHFIIEHQNLLWLVDELKKRGIKVTRTTENEFAEACQAAHRRIMRKEVETSNEKLVQHQVPRGVRRNKTNGGWVINRAKSGVEIDAMIASILAIYGADRYKEATLQLF